MVVVVSAL